MTKKMPTIGVIGFSSLSEMGYKQAAIGDSLVKIAQHALEKIAGFPEEISAEAKAELYEGYFRRYSENNPPVTYAVINGHYIKATPEHVDNGAIDKVAIGVEYAFSMTPIEFGKLKNTEPERHAVIAKIRDATQTYASNRLGDLKRAARRLIEPKGRNRTTLDFIESINKAFDAFDKSAKVKQAKGDTTADATRFRMARDAFWKVYNAK